MEQKTRTKQTDYTAAAQADELHSVAGEPAAYRQTMDFSIRVPYAEGIDKKEMEHRLSAYARMLLAMPHNLAYKRSTHKESGMSIEEAESYLDSIVCREHHFVPTDMNGMRNMPNKKYM